MTESKLKWREKEFKCEAGENKMEVLIIFVFMLLYFVCVASLLCHINFSGIQIARERQFQKRTQYFFSYAHTWRCDRYVWIGQEWCININDWSRTELYREWERKIYEWMRNLIRVISCYFRNLSSALLSFKCLDKKKSYSAHVFFFMNMGKQRYFWGSRD